MDEKLREVRDELAVVINELNVIAQGIESDFSGIGEKDCTLSLYKTIRFYQKKLNVIDSELSTSKFSSSGGNFGGGGGGGRF